MFRCEDRSELSTPVEDMAFASFLMFASFEESFLKIVGVFILVRRSAFAMIFLIVIDRLSSILLNAYESIYSSSMRVNSSSSDLISSFSGV